MAYNTSTSNFHFISTQSVSNVAAVSIASGFSASYKSMKVIVSGLQIVTGSNLLLNCSTNGGSSYDSGDNYSYSQVILGSDSTNNWNRQAGSPNILLLTNGPSSSTSTDNCGFELNIFSAVSASQYTLFQAQIPMVVGSNLYINQVGGAYTGATGVNALQFTASGSHNIFSGTFSLYGIT
jgi:hypothetical protein